MPYLVTFRSKYIVIFEINTLKFIKIDFLTSSEFQHQFCLKAGVRFLVRFMKYALSKALDR